MADYLLDALRLVHITVGSSARSVKTELLKCYTARDESSYRSSMILNFLGRHRDVVIRLETQVKHSELGEERDIRWQQWRQTGDVCHRGPDDVVAATAVLEAHAAGFREHITNPTVD